MNPLIEDEELSRLLNVANYFSWRPFRPWAESSDISEGRIDDVSFIRPYLENKEGVECPGLKDLQAAGRLPPDEWRKPLAKVQFISGRWLASKSPDAEAVAQHVNALSFFEELVRQNKEMTIKIRGKTRRIRYADQAAADSARSRVKEAIENIELHLKAIGKLVSDAMLDGETQTMKALLDLVKRWKGETRKVHAKPLELSVIERAFALWRKHKRNPTRNELWAACEARGIKLGDANNKLGLLKKTGLQFLARG
jgi:hypothetical protein